VPVKPVPVQQGRVDPKQCLAQLQEKDRVVAEIARRGLCRLHKSVLPTARLVALLGSDNRRVRNDAVSVLMHHGVATDELRRFLTGTDPMAKRSVLALAQDDELQRIVAEASVAVRVCALGMLQDRGVLSDEVLQQAVLASDGALSETGCRILVLERSPFALKVAEAAIDAGARMTLLELLAARPRIGAGPWLMRLLDQNKLDPQGRILAIQALPRSWLNKRLAREVVEAAGDRGATMRFGTQIAAARFTPRVADLMVPAVLHLIQSGTRPSDVLPCLVNVTATGEQGLLAQGEKLGKIPAEEICAWLGGRGSKAIADRITAALAGTGRFDSYLLRLSGPYLKTPAHVAKVVEFLEGDDKTLRILAFDELLEARVYDPAMLEYATEVGDRGRRAWRLLQMPPDVLPELAYLELLASEEVNVVMQSCRVLSTVKLSKKLEERLLTLAREHLIGVVRRAAKRAVLLAGSEATGTQVWKDLSADDKRDFAIDWLIERPRVWSHELLLRERSAYKKIKQPGRSAERYYHRVLLALARLGDRGAREELLTVVHRMQPDLLRRSKQTLLRQFSEEKVAILEALLSAADGRLNEEQRVELLEWLQARPDLVSGLKDMLRRVWKEDSSYEVRLGALRGLLSGPGAAELYKEVTASLTRPRTDEQEEVMFEVVGSLVLPLSHDALEFLAKVVLLTPLADPKAEVRASLVVGWEGTRGEYPMQRPVANLLRRDQKVRPRDAFRRTAESLDPRFINRRRLGLFLSLIAIRGSLFEDLGPVLARAILSAPDRSQDFVGPAHLALGVAAEQDGDHAAAARHYRLAGSHMLRRQLPRFLARAFLGEADALVRYHPLADLAARPHLCDARVQMANKNWSAAKNSLAMAEDLALGDKDAMAEVTELSQLVKKEMAR
jgi:hypothetical protein